MERNEISRQEVSFYVVAARDTAWRTAHELADASGVAHRTGRAFSLKYVRLGLFDQAEVWPSHRYRLSLMAGKRNKAYLQRLNQAIDVFGFNDIKGDISCRMI